MPWTQHWGFWSQVGETKTVLSQRHERGSLIVSTNKAYKHWAEIFNNDAGITAAILDRLRHRAQTVVIEGKSYRMKERLIEEPAS